MPVYTSECVDTLSREYKIIADSVSELRDYGKKYGIPEESFVDGVVPYYKVCDLTNHVCNILPEAQFNKKWSLLSYIDPDSKKYESVDSNLNMPMVRISKKWFSSSYVYDGKERREVIYNINFFKEIRKLPDNQYLFVFSDSLGNEFSFNISNIDVVNLSQQVNKLGLV